MHHSTFITSLILLCLPPETPLAKKYSESLLKERGDSWTWNYLPRGGVEGQTKKYPDDLDSTSLAIAALTLHTPEKVTVEALVHFTKVLIAAESSAGSPYHTWIVPSDLRKDWQDVDIAVNANIAFALSLHDVSLPNIESMCEQAIQVDAYPSLYYHEPLVTLYFISRWYKGKYKEKAMRNILKRRTQEGIWENPMLTALAMTALLNFGYDKKHLKECFYSLVQYKDSDISRSYPIYIEENKGSTTYAENIELTTAFIDEAISKCQPKNEVCTKEQLRIKSEVLRGIKKRCGGLSVSLSRPIVSLSMEITTHDTGEEITLLPYYFSQSMSVPSPSLAKKLGIANLFGWIAYKIYDDILDGEGDTSLLPSANVCLRELTSIYRDLLSHNRIRLFHRIMDKMEQANEWERRNCFNNEELPNYGNLKVLADKSMGHALGPITLLLSAGYGEHSEEIRSLVSYFEHYLIARQLNDDAHDWLDDLRRGFRNSVSVRILRKAGPYSRSERCLQRIFWDEVIDSVVIDISEHIALARKNLETLLLSGVVRDTRYLSSLLVPIEKAAKEAAVEKIRTKRFLSYLHAPNTNANTKNITKK